MSSDLLVANLCPLPTITLPAIESRPRPIQFADRDDLAVSYRDSYPPETGAADLAAAEAEIDASFTGEFGVLRHDASLVLDHGGHAVGAILVTTRSIWDDNLPGPFVIDLFVNPAFRRSGGGTMLVYTAMQRCAANGDRRLSLRVGEGTSSTAFDIYERLGFSDPEPEAVNATTNERPGEEPV